MSLVTYPAVVGTNERNIIPWGSQLKRDVQVADRFNSERAKSQQQNKKYLDNKATLSVFKLFPHLINHFEKAIVISWPEQYFKNNVIACSPKARVSSVRYYDTANPKVIICTSGNKFCANVERRHKKNNIFFEIDIHNFSFTQRCHDELCVEYKSREIGLLTKLFFSSRSNMVDLKF